MSNEDKSFEASDHKLEEARKRGEVPHANDLVRVISALSLVLVLWLLGEWMFNRLEGLMNNLTVLAFSQQVESPMWLAFKLATQEVMFLCVPIALLVSIVNVLTNFMVVGPVASAKPITPDFKRLNPVDGFKRIFSRDTWFALGKGLVALCVMFIVLGYWIVGRLSTLQFLSTYHDALKAIGTILPVEVLIGLIVLLIIGVLDLLFQRWSFLRRQKMDMKDLIDEQKQTEGDPQIKADRKEMHKELIK